MTVKRKAAVRPTLVSIAVPYAEPVAVGEPGDLADVGQHPGHDHWAKRWEGSPAGSRGQHHGLQLGGGLLDLRLDHHQLGEFLGRDAATGLVGDVTRTQRTRASIALARPVVMSGLAWPASSSASNARSRSTVCTRRRVS